jgi:hypothetical protein
MHFTKELLEHEYFYSKVVNGIDHSCFKSSVFSEFAHAYIPTFNGLQRPGPLSESKMPD